ncbi:acetyl-CoA carboxylase biotin carboxyl carrier protein subunit (plasmid) [Rhizobium ruizarguesonis]|uniref:Biotin carboxyl carrier protein of acetyl-CoA carboxylase n=1 Tax=Rhizobium ruizarguesonis TaxID=2081791 RepID=A0ABY1WVV6_9HYPH|nr:acetyl-CoA carboxylase biotin carboxyl carrier protein subunit [Rhizobium ruizarguesonis]TAU13518.1 acetyl-CoA carboxylase biotin carboxyl carrier protein subunit [Rhizobium ruizarguesonis]TAU57356.1 acetyl-CoA carboxylase biotin carboxyl carrier protein subunit [Rhizobium ruizarguesonis]TAV01972.1 acetyl-CoA carboxylase biotin carboxyl carrier protein subunit [Rhizobium ruizarguesonis]TAV20090.1 acetyl-CoA carboxylase biotin carboxyl carrier protein subunit [Rhizobium ruizarguesonis]TAV206
MDLSKIKTLIDFVGRSNITELTVTEKDVTVRIFRASQGQEAAAEPEQEAGSTTSLGNDAGTDTPSRHEKTYVVKAPVFGVLHRTPAPGELPFVTIGDEVEEGQTLFIIEAMKVFNTIAAPRSGRITHLTEIDDGEVETGDLLAEIA